MCYNCLCEYVTLFKDVLDYSFGIIFLEPLKHKYQSHYQKYVQAPLESLVSQQNSSFTVKF